MAKKKDDMSKYAKDLIGGGATLSLGAGVIGKLPASAAQTGVQQGLGTAGKFFKSIATVGAAGIVMKQLKNLKGVKKKKK